MSADDPSRIDPALSSTNEPNDLGENPTLLPLAQEPYIAGRSPNDVDMSHDEAITDALHAPQTLPPLQTPLPAHPPPPPEPTHAELPPSAPPPTAAQAATVRAGTAPSDPPTTLLSAPGRAPPSIKPDPGISSAALPPPFPRPPAPEEREPLEAAQYAENTHGDPTRVYINTRVTPHLLEGMKYLAVYEPEKPLRWLSEFLGKRSREVEGS